MMNKIKKFYSSILFYFKYGMNELAEKTGIKKGINKFIAWRLKKGIESALKQEQYRKDLEDAKKEFKEMFSKNKKV